MAISRKLQVSMDSVLPDGALLLTGPEEVLNYDPGAVRPDGSRPQQLDKETGLPVWSCLVLDLDPEASRRDKTVTVKLVAPVQPVPPANKSGLPFTPVRFENLTLTPWIDDNGPRPRIAWSIRATGFADESGSSRPTEQHKAA